jgi:hypothetical protein
VKVRGCHHPPRQRQPSFACDPNSNHAPLCAEPARRAPGQEPAGADDRPGPSTLAHLAGPGTASAPAGVTRGRQAASHTRHIARRNPALTGRRSSCARVTQKWQNLNHAQGRRLPERVFYRIGAASGGDRIRLRIALPLECQYDSFQQRPWRCCRDRQDERSKPSPIWVQALRTEIGRPSSNIRFSAWTATSTSAARRWSVRERSPSPITCLNLPMVASTRARMV